MITFKQKGDFSNTFSFLKKAEKLFDISILDKYGKKGVEILQDTTPTKSGATAVSWSYSIEKVNKYVMKLVFNNDNIQNGTNIAIILDKGHGTKGGGWVEGRNYITPALQPVFSEMINELWEEVNR